MLPKLNLNKIARFSMPSIQKQIHQSSQKSLYETKSQQPPIQKSIESPKDSSQTYTSPKLNVSTFLQKPKEKNINQMFRPISKHRLEKLKDSFIVRSKKKVYQTNSFKNLNKTFVEAQEQRIQKKVKKANISTIIERVSDNNNDSLYCKSVDKKRLNFDPIQKSDLKFCQVFTPLTSNIPLQPTPKDNKTFNFVKDYFTVSKVSKSKKQLQIQSEDCHCEILDFNRIENQYLFITMVGHGNYGLQIANYVKKILPNFITHQNQNIQNTFEDTQLQIEKKLGSICNKSGCSCTIILMQKNGLLTCANLGNCRALIAEFKENEWFWKQMTNDHCISNQSELNRLSKEDQQFWNSNDVKQTRGFGYLNARKKGMISIPDIQIHNLDTKTKRFIILASEGFWSTMQNGQVFKIVRKAYEENDCKGACAKLVNLARSILEYNSNVFEDITLTLIFM